MRNYCCGSHSSRVISPGSCELVPGVDALPENAASAECGNYYITRQGPGWRPGLDNVSATAQRGTYHAAQRLDRVARRWHCANVFDPDRLAGYVDRLTSCHPRAIGI